MSKLLQRLRAEFLRSNYTESTLAIQLIDKAIEREREKPSEHEMLTAGEALHEAVAGYLVDNGTRSADGLTWESGHDHPLAKPFIAASAFFDGDGYIMECGHHSRHERGVVGTSQGQEMEAEWCEACAAEPASQPPGNCSGGAGVTDLNNGLGS